MSPVRVRALGAVFVGLAVVLYAALVVPLREATAEAERELQRARQERRETRARLTAASRRDALRRRVAAVAARNETAPKDSLGFVRESLLASLEGARLTGVRLQVQPARPRGGAAVRLSAEGEFSDVAAFSDRLIRVGGLILERVHLRPTANGLAIEADGLSLAVSP